MSTKNFMSNILDELMGRNRDALPTDIPKEIQWDDPEICPYYLVCFCPHELFVNTKADLGSCSKFHDDQLRQKYQEEAPSYKRSQFEKEFLRFAEKMLSDIEGKIKRGKHRIAAANGADGGIYAGPGSRNAEEIVLLTDRINALLEEAEAAGCEGDVEKAQGIMKLCDQIKEEREKLKSNEISHPWNPDKAMQVCEVCGSYLIIGEAQHRLDDHIMGKQHVGFAMLRKSMEDVRKALQKREDDEREQMERERERRLSSRREERASSDRRKDDGYRRGGGNDARGGGRRGRDDKDADRDRDRKRHRSRSRDKDKEKDKDKKDKDKDKDKEKDRQRDKDRDKDRDRDRRRDSSRDRKRHSESKKDKRSKRSRSRSKSKSRKRSRSKSRDRKDRKSRRSRSKSRDRKDRRSKSRSRDRKSRRSKSRSRERKDRHSHRNRDRNNDKDKDKDKEVSPSKGKESPTANARSEDMDAHDGKDDDGPTPSRRSSSPHPDSSSFGGNNVGDAQERESPASSGSV